MDQLSTYRSARLAVFPSWIDGNAWSWAMTLSTYRRGSLVPRLAETGQILPVPGVPPEAQAREALFEVARMLRTG